MLTGKRLAWFEYNGTCDVVISCLHDGPPETGDNYDTYFSGPECKWRDHDWKSCTCGKPSTDVLLWNNYGWGNYWMGRVCLDCKAVTHGRVVFDMSCPDKMCQKNGCKHVELGGKEEDESDSYPETLKPFVGLTHADVFDRCQK